MTVLVLFLTHLYWFLLGCGLAALCLKPRRPMTREEEQRYVDTLRARMLLEALWVREKWSLWERFLLAVAYIAPCGARVILDRDGHRPYLLRSYLWRTERKLSARWPHWMSRGLYLHVFMRSDEDADCHNHPWEDSYSLILARGYEEDVLEKADAHPIGWIGPEIRRHTRRPGQLLKIGREHYHRVHLHNGHAITLFCPGRRVAKGPEAWGFHDGWDFIPSCKYLDRVRGA